MWPTGISTENSGFTLIELVVVVTLLSLLGLVSVPLLLNQGESAERRVMRRLVGTVKQLYNEATLTRDEHLLTFDLDRNQLQSYRMRSSNGQVEKERFGKERSLEPLRLQQVDIAGKGSFRRGQVSVRIFPLGWMDETRVALLAETGKITEFAFSPLTGAVTIEDGRQTLR